MTDDTTNDQGTQTPPAAEPGANAPPPSGGTSTPGLAQLAPKFAKPDDDLYARARASGLSRDILAWQDARGT